MVRRRNQNSFNCKQDCSEMEDLKDQWRGFIKSYKSSKRWFITIIIAIMAMFTPYTISSYATSKSAVKYEQLQEYVKTDEMLSWLLLEMEYVKKITLLNKAEISDTLINEVFENHKWMLEQFMEYNPRAIRNKPDYAKILNNYKKRNE
jgi:hypothetical protein